jgi:retron-type reverse transcriptase
VDNLLVSWKEFLHGKRKRKDVIAFSLHFMDNVLALHKDLRDKSYQHGVYEHFKINDPKPRDIHKASVRDRLVHHAVYRILYPYFDRQFIHDSYSCRLEKGTHRALNRFRKFANKVSRNHHRTVWVLKCDIRKFFANIDHAILKDTLKRHIPDDNINWLLAQLIDNFNTVERIDVGLPLGNLTSQLFVNVYMNEFDQFVKRRLKVKYYLRYADDFVVLHENKAYVQNLIPHISDFLQSKLKLQLHPDKLFIKTLCSGIDFLGWVHFSRHRVPRTSTRRRMMRRLGKNSSKESVASYLGMLKHGNTHKISQLLTRMYGK